MASAAREPLAHTCAECGFSSAIKWLLTNHVKRAHSAKKAGAVAATSESSRGKKVDARIRKVCSKAAKKVAENKEPGRSNPVEEISAAGKPLSSDSGGPKPLIECGQDKGSNSNEHGEQEVSANEDAEPVVGAAANDVGELVEQPIELTSNGQDKDDSWSWLGSSDNEDVIEQEESPEDIVSAENGAVSGNDGAENEVDENMNEFSSTESTENTENARDTNTRYEVQTLLTGSDGGSEAHEEHIDALMDAEDFDMNYEPVTESAEETVPGSDPLSDHVDDSRNVVSVDDVLKCPHCSFRTKFRYNLNKHLASSHSIADGDDDLREEALGQQLHACNQCDFVTPQLAFLTNHMMYVNVEKLCS